jgi:hypothetical protein
MLAHEDFRPQVISSGVLRTRSEEAPDVLMPLLKKQKTRRTSLYQISKLSLSLDVVDITEELVARWARPVPAPGVEALRTHLRQPLKEEDKIPISKKLFDRLCVRYPQGSRVNALSSHELSTLFRVSGDECAYDLQTLFQYAIQSEPPPTGTEDLFHSIYGINIAKIIEFILSNATSIRNSNRNSSTALQRPDYGLIVNTHCILRGEEKGSGTPGDPEKELLLKLRRGWDHNPLRYTLGLL